VDAECSCYPDRQRGNPHGHCHSQHDDATLGIESVRCLLYPPIAAVNGHEWNVRRGLFLDFGTEQAQTLFIHIVSRRALIRGASAAGAMLGLAGCASTPTRLTDVDPVYRRADVPYATREPRGAIVVDPPRHYLYYVEGGGIARRYGIAVGGEGFGWSGVATVHSKQEWPDWYPTKEILERHPELTAGLKELPSGQGVPGGPDNPLGARALYLWQGNKDTLYRIHGTNEPWKIGGNVSSGCIRLINDDVIELYDRVGIGTKVVVLASNVG